MPRGTRNRTTKKPQSEYKKKIVKIRAEINKIESKKTTQKVGKTKSWFSESINNVNKPLTRLINKKREDPNK